MLRLQGYALTAGFICCPNSGTETVTSSNTNHLYQKWVCLWNGITGPEGQFGSLSLWMCGYVGKQCTWNLYTVARPQFTTEEQPGNWTACVCRGKEGISIALCLYNITSQLFLVKIPFSVQGTPCSKWYVVGQTLDGLSTCCPCIFLPKTEG